MSKTIDMHSRAAPRLLRLPARFSLAITMAVALISIALALTACNLLTRSVAPDTPTAPPPTLTLPPTLPPASPTPTQPTTTTLVLWTTGIYSPSTDTPAGQILAQELADFQASHPGVAVDVILKNSYGKGGILDFLMTSSAVAPSILPDIVVIDTAELGTAARAGILQPLDNLISAEIREDLFPSAVRAGQVGEQLMGIQFEADIEHLAYNLAKMQKPPVTWTDVLTSGITYIFPAAGRNGMVNDAFLIQYYGAGGRFFDDTGHPALDQTILAEVLSFYRDGAALGAIPRDVLDYKSIADCWPVYLSARVSASHVTSAHYLSDRHMLLSTGFAPIPTRDGKAVTINRGWALALVTKDPDRQALAASLLEWLLDPENNATWNQAAGHLPTRRSAFEYLDQTDEYVTFAYRRLENARPYPTEPGFEQMSRALQQAVQNVLSGQATPEEAVAAVMSTIRP
ncbi:MAG: extracellular solute-binding protein [Anaerolineae bacterium]|nr:extracellular solute-binding protein [Anaerolineae bacterium]MDH7473436.1 extracellular solute-binding protein [Anaerolineae bacterium]